MIKNYQGNKNKSLIVYSIVLLFIAKCSFAQSPLPVIRSNNKAINFKTDKGIDGWNISPELKPDVLEVPVSNKPVRVTFITDVDSISFTVTIGDKYDFIILLNGKDSAYTQVIGVKDNPAAVFSKKYIATHNNKTFIEVPEVYELVNIMFAITDMGKNDSVLVYKQSDYYRNVLAWFDQYRNEPSIKKFNELLQQGQYFFLKMDAYAFVFDKKDKIVKSDTYNRVAWGKFNTILPYISLVQEFSDRSSFRKFYARNRITYDMQKSYFRDTLDITEMQKWLNQNFPATKYNSFKVIFSPLVARNQSANWFENNGFKEAQAHVNFPYPSFRKDSNLAPAIATIMAGNILFTELNHAFINIEANKFVSQIDNYLKDLGKWAASDKPSRNYNNPTLCFNEYLNWALVSLRIIDYVPLEQQDELINSIGKLGEGRGFKKFPEFNQFLVSLYRNRKPGTTVADLYPQVVEWFGKQ